MKKSLYILRFTLFTLLISSLTFPLFSANSISGDYEGNGSAGASFATNDTLTNDDFNPEPSIEDIGSVILRAWGDDDNPDGFEPGGGTDDPGTFVDAAPIEDAHPIIVFFLVIYLFFKFRFDKK